MKINLFSGNSWSARHVNRKCILKEVAGTSHKLCFGQLFKHVAAWDFQVQVAAASDRQETFPILMPFKQHLATQFAQQELPNGANLALMATISWEEISSGCKHSLEMTFELQQQQSKLRMTQLIFLVHFRVTRIVIRHDASRRMRIRLSSINTWTTCLLSTCVCGTFEYYWSEVLALWTIVVCSRFGHEP